MGLCNKCCCCPCLTKQASARVCTWFFILLIGIVIVINFIRGGFHDTTTIVLSVLEGLIVISLILLLIGFRTLNRPLLKQFKWIFGAFVIVHLIATVVYDIFYYILFRNSTDKSTIEEYRKTLNKLNLTDSQITTTIKTYAISGIALYTLFLILSLTYYFTTRNYVNEIVREVTELKSTKKIESGEEKA